MDTQAVLKRLHKILLTWDYYELCEKAENGTGVFADLKSVPNSFKDIQARGIKHIIPKRGAHVVSTRCRQCC